MNTVDYRQPAVALFQTKFKQWDGESILSFPKPKNNEELQTYKLRLKLTIEETFELFESILTPEAYKSFDTLLGHINEYIENISEEHVEVKPVDLFDALVDIDYVNMGFANLLNLDIKSGFDEVQKSNMSKLGEDGEPIYREDGKILKGPNYFQPDLKSVYENTEVLSKLK